MIFLSLLDSFRKIISSVLGILIARSVSLLDKVQLGRISLNVVLESSAVCVMVILPY